jgi:hypothetical protein
MRIGSLLTDLVGRYGTNPFAVASLSQTSIKNSQAYDIEIVLTMPQSPDNVAHGNFMVGLLLLGDVQQTQSAWDAQPPRYDDKVSPFSSIVQPVDIASYTANRKILHVSTRPARVPYRSSLVSKAASLLRLPYHAVWPGSETSTVVVRMAERLTFGRGTPVPNSILVELQAGQHLQVYEAAVTLTAQLKGLRYFMYQYRITAFVMFTGLFWLAGMAAFSILFVLPSGKGGKVKTEGDESNLEGEDDPKGKKPAIKKEGELSDTERTFPSSSKQPALKYEGRIKQEEIEESNMPPVNPGALADDEDDEEEDWRARDSGIGTSFSDNRSREGTRKRSTKGSS